MSYPQPDSNVPALRGIDFFRLKTELFSPGDLYESEQGSHAFAIGPDSDIPSASIFYFDEQQDTTRLTELEISVKRSFAGTLNARLDTTYPLSLRPGRLLIAPAVLYNPSWRPIAFSVAHDAINFITPVFDVIQYFSPQPGLQPSRNDKEFSFASFNGFAFASSGKYWLVLPAYGRKSASFIWDNATANSAQAGVHMKVVVFGIRLAEFTPSTGDNANAEITLHTEVEIDQGDHAIYNYKESTDGALDYFVLQYSIVSGAPTETTGFNTSVVVSDDHA